MALDYGYTIRIQSNGSSNPSTTPTNQWQKKASGSSTWTDISGARSTTYVVAREDQSAKIRLKQDFNGSPAYSNELTVTSSAPLDPWGTMTGSGSWRKTHEEGVINGEKVVYFRSNSFSEGAYLAKPGTTTMERVTISSTYFPKDGLPRYSSRDNKWLYVYNKDVYISTNGKTGWVKQSNQLPHTRGNWLYVTGLNYFKGLYVLTCGVDSASQSNRNMLSFWSTSLSGPWTIGTGANSGDKPGGSNTNPRYNNLVYNTAMNSNYLVMGAQYGNIYYTSDGKNWNIKTVSDSHNYTVAYAFNNFWVADWQAKSTNTPKVYKASNPGGSWSSVNFGVSISQQQYAMVGYDETENALYIGNDTRIYKTKNGSSFSSAIVPRNMTNYFKYMVVDSGTGKLYYTHGSSNSLYYGALPVN